MAKSNTKQKKKLSPMQQQAGFLRRKMRMSRIVGTICCLAIIVTLVMYYLKRMNEWLAIINICYCIATIFVSNSFLQDIKVGNPWQRINGLISILFYLATVGLIIWGFANGQLTTQF